MKLLSLSALLFTSLVASSGWARDITTTTGVVYHNAVVTKTQPDGVRIVHDDGAGFIDYQILSDADRKEFGYDPATYAAAGKDQAGLEKQRQQLQLMAARQALYLAGKAAEAAIAYGTPSPYDAPPVAAPQPAPWPTTTIEASLQTPDFTYGSYGSSGWVSWPYVPSTYIASPTTVARLPRGTTVIVNPGAGNNVSTGAVITRQPIQGTGFTRQTQSVTLPVPAQTAVGTSFGGRFGGASSIPSAASRR